VEAPQATTIETQLFQPAIGPRNYLTVEGTSIPEHKRLSFGMALNYQRHPYTVFTEGPTPGSTNVVDYQLSTELSAAMGLFGKYQVGLAVPFTLYLAGDEVSAMGLPTGGRFRETGIGDLRVEGKALLATLGEEEEYTIGLSAGLTLPTGDTGDRRYLGDKMITGRIKAIGTAELWKIRAAANLGLLLRQTSHNFATELGHQLLYGAAAAYPVERRVDLIVSMFGRSGLAHFTEFYSDVNPFEVNIAGRWNINAMWSATVGGGRGFGHGIGAPDLRLFGMASFNPDFRDRDKDGIFDVNDRCPDQPEDRDGFQDMDGCPDTDNDGDGVEDGRDRCVNEPEDLDQFQDDDGCAEPDNDKDGIPDLNDACPNAAEDGGGKQPKDGCPSTTEDSDGDGIADHADKCADEVEDKDGFQDDDGCPDPDNDADGVPDDFDGCVNDAEDPDGFEDEDGCPDPDNDKDGLLDAVDRCPTQPETLNGNKDEDGCPDPGTELVRLSPNRIEVEGKIGFSSKGGKLVVKDASVKLVNLVALVLKGHREITRLRIEVRADGVPQMETQKRADAVRDLLVAKGVEATRVVPAGMGAGSAGVEFLIDSTPAPATPAPAPVPQPTPAPAAAPIPTPPPPPHPAASPPPPGVK
jgi:OmpA-OmpF porin, OOP family